MTYAQLAHLNGMTEAEANFYGYSFSELLNLLNNNLKLAA